MMRTLFRPMVRMTSMLAFCASVALVTSCSEDDDAPALPTITSVSPAEAFVGDKITVTGTNLETTTAVQLNGIDVVIGTKTATTVEFTVPEGATSGKVKVTTPAGSATSTSDVAILCDEDGVNADAFLNFSTLESGDVGLSKSVELMGAPGDAVATGLANPVEGECSTVAKYVKAAGQWGGWNGFKLVLDAPMSASEFNAFASQTSTAASKPAKKLKVDVYYDGTIASGQKVDLFVNAGNNATYVWPRGRTQFFIGEITKGKEWETVTLEVKYADDGSVIMADIDTGNELDDASATDLFEFLPAGGNQDGGTFYFDNLRVE